MRILNIENNFFENSQLLHAHFYKNKKQIWFDFCKKKKKCTKKKQQAKLFYLNQFSELKSQKKLV